MLLVIVQHRNKPLVGTLALVEHSDLMWKEPGYILSSSLKTNTKNVSYHPVLSIKVNGKKKGR